MCYIDRIDGEQIQQFREIPIKQEGLKPVEIPLKKIGFTKDPRPGVGRYKQIKQRIPDKDSPAFFPYTR